ncbi:MAG: hypothetical protein FD123_2329, partial [Bacteroidetes bacterium]
MIGALKTYPGRELNPYGRCWPQDFKSGVSTNSTTQASTMTMTVKNKNHTTN